MIDNAFAAFRDGSVREYRLTIIETLSLVQRLTAELSFAVDRIKQIWPELKSDPVGFGLQLGVKCRVRITDSLREPNTLAGIFAAMVIVSVAVLLTILGPGRGVGSPDPTKSSNALSEIVSLSFAPQTANRPGSGIGAGSNGRVGLAEGQGEGSKRETRSSRGGGGSGDLDKLPPQKGRPFQPSEIPAKLSPVRKNPSLPSGGIDIDPMLWKDQPLVTYGDPRSGTTNPSQGPGEGGNFGSGKGPGTGEGDGPGFGPGEQGNIGGGAKSQGGGGEGGSLGNNPDDPDRVLRVSQVTQRARVFAKPEPQYTEEARRAQITGTVVLRVVFSRSGQVTNIRAVQSLPFGLTEKAIAAARQIRFSPAFKGGRPVSVYMQLEYNFNLY